MRNSVKLFSLINMKIITYITCTSCSNICLRYVHLLFLNFSSIVIYFFSIEIHVIKKNRPEIINFSGLNNLLSLVYIGQTSVSVLKGE